MNRLLVAIKAEYHGKPLFSYQMPNYFDIDVYGIYETDNVQHEVKELGWVYERVVLIDNSFLFTVKHKNFFCELYVPFIQNAPNSINAVYLGPPVLTGTNYDTSKLYVDLRLKDGTIKVLSFGEYIVSSFLVSHTENNIYEITYAGLSDKFSVYGYNVNNGYETDFKAFIIHDNGFEDDVSETIYKLLYEPVTDKIYITLNKLNKYLFPSKYRFILPRGTGMLQKYASEWIIEKDETNVKAKMIQVFN